MDILQIVLSSLASLGVLFLLTKLMGNKQISQLNLFDYITGITIGSIAAEMATELEAPIRPLAAMVVYGVSAWAISVLTNKSISLRRWVNGRPQVLYENGVFCRKSMQKAHIDVNEFLTLCRISGYFDLQQIHTAVMEHNGTVSFLPMEQYRPATPEDMGLHPEQATLPVPVILDGTILKGKLHTLQHDEAWLLRRLTDHGYADARDIMYAAIDAQGTLLLYPSKQI